jgi:hypothetical protein
MPPVLILALVLVLATVTGASVAVVVVRTDGDRLITSEALGIMVTANSVMDWGSVKVVESLAPVPVIVQVRLGGKMAQL